MSVWHIIDRIMVILAVSQPKQSGQSPVIAYEQSTIRTNITKSSISSFLLDKNSHLAKGAGIKHHSRSNNNFTSCLHSTETE
jgi:hypothetical protein